MKVRKVTVVAIGVLMSVAAAVIVSIEFGSAHDSGRRVTMTSENPAVVHVARAQFRAEKLRLGMNKAEVEHVMGRAADTEATAGTTVDVSTYRAGTEEPVDAQLTIENGKLSAVALDVAGIRGRPAFTRPVIPGLSRAGVIRALGEPQEDYEETIKGLKIEHMLFESPTHTTASIFLVSGRVIAVSAGRAAPPDLASVTLPIAPSAPTVGQPIERIRLGMTPSTVVAICGEATWSVHSSFKGLAMLVLSYASTNGDIYARFTFVGEALTEMSIWPSGRDIGEAEAVSAS